MNTNIEYQWERSLFGGEKKTRKQGESWSRMARLTGLMQPLISQFGFDQTWILTDLKEIRENCQQNKDEYEIRVPNHNYFMETRTRLSKSLLA